MNIKVGIPVAPACCLPWLQFPGAKAEGKLVSCPCRQRLPTCMPQEQLALVHRELWVSI